MLPVLGDRRVWTLPPPPPNHGIFIFPTEKNSITGEHNVDPTPSPETWIRTPDPRLDEAQTDK